MKIGHWDSDSGKTFVVADIGANHDGSLGMAESLIDAVADAGADAVKFQSYLADELVTADSPDYRTLKRLEIPEWWCPQLKYRADACGLVFFSTATNDITLRWLERVNAACYKIASGNLTHLPLIRRVARLGKPLIVSTGMADLHEIGDALEAADIPDNIALLHCTSEYPTPVEHANLHGITTLRAAFGDSAEIGYSDHTMSVVIPAVAIGMGARIIEKHITFDRSRLGPDHSYALHPFEFATMVSNIRTTEQAMGNGEKQPTQIEREKAPMVRRSLHAARDIPMWHGLVADDIAVVRPEDGLHPRNYDVVLGKTTLRPLRKGDPITLDVLFA